jgi:nucleoside 2-deoxyribosyltransferase
MIISICGSMQFHKEMSEIQKTLESAGHTVLVPKSIELMETIGYVHPTIDEAKVSAKIQHDFIKEHFRKIEKSDSILVLNYDKKGIKNYIGGNTFLEIGLAYWLGKKVYLLNPVPEMDYVTELRAMQPVILNGDLTLIGHMLS